MIKNIIGDLLVLTSFTFIAASSGILGIENNSGMRKDGYTREVFVASNLKVIQEFCDFYRQHAKGNLTDGISVERCDTFVSFTKHLLETMRAGKQDACIQKLTEEIERAFIENNTSPVWLVEAHFRYLALLQDLSADEKDIFFHLPYHKYLIALLAKDVKEKAVVVDFYKWGMALDNEGEHFYKPGNQAGYIPALSQEAQKQINQEIIKHLPSPIIYPSLGGAIFSIELILNCWMDQIHLIGMPTTNIKKVHGEDVTPLGFAIHDLFHFKLDNRLTALKLYVGSAVADYINKGFFASDIIPCLVPLAVQKYELIMEALKKAYLIAKIEKHTLIGAFIAFYETPTFSKRLFDLSSPIEIIEEILARDLSYYKEKEAWENPCDVLTTSPLTGETLKSQEEIKQVALLQALEDQSLIVPHMFYNQLNERGSVIGYISNPEAQKSIKKEWLLKVARFKVEKSFQFIDAIFELPNGETKTYSFPTLVRKWKNIDASLGLLNFAGIDIKKPALITENPEENRKIAMKTLEDVQLHLLNTLDAFGKKAKDFFGKGLASYTEEYITKFKNIQENERVMMKKFKVNKSLVKKVIFPEV